MKFLLCLFILPGFIFVSVEDFTYWTGIEDAYYCDLIRIKGSEELFRNGETCKDNPTWYGRCPTAVIPTGDLVCDNTTNLAFNCPLSCNQCGSDAFLTVPTSVIRGEKKCTKLSSRRPWNCIETESDEIHLKHYIEFHISKDVVVDDVPTYCTSGATQHDFRLQFLFRRRGRISDPITGLERSTKIKVCLILELSNDDNLYLRTVCFNNTDTNYIKEADFSTQPLNSAWRQVRMAFNDIPCTSGGGGDDVTVFIEIDKGSEHFDIDEVFFEIPDESETQATYSVEFRGIGYIDKTLTTRSSRWDCYKRKRGVVDDRCGRYRQDDYKLIKYTP